MSQSSLTDHVENAVDDAKQNMREGVRDTAETVQTGAVEETDQTADAAYRAAQAFDTGSLQAAALGQIAQSLDGVSRSLRERSIDGLADDVALFARRNPLLFLSGAALAGFAAARFLKSSPVQTTVVEEPWTNHLSSDVGRMQ